MTYITGDTLITRFVVLSGDSAVTVGEGETEQEAWAAAHDEAFRISACIWKAEALLEACEVVEYDPTLYDAHLKPLT